MRTTIAIALVSLFSLTAAHAQNNVTVTVTNLENDNGQLMLELVDQKGKVVEQRAEYISQNETTMTFKNLENGTYAIRYYHDENGNGKMDTGTFGIPKEGYGFSNNARGFMGPPDFEDMLFEVDGDVKMRLKTVN